MGCVFPTVSHQEDVIPSGLSFCDDSICRLILSALHVHCSQVPPPQLSSVVLAVPDGPLLDILFTKGLQNGNILVVSFFLYQQDLFSLVIWLPWEMAPTEKAEHALDSWFLFTHCWNRELFPSHLSEVASTSIFGALPQAHGYYHAWGIPICCGLFICLFNAQNTAFQLVVLCPPDMAPEVSHIFLAAGITGGPGATAIY